MPVNRDQARVIKEWARKASNDLGFAVPALRATPEGFTDAACFHAQQCVEKYRKALLLADGQDVPKTHSIDKLWKLLPEDKRPELSQDERVKLTSYAVTIRYEGANDPTVAEARSAVEIAERVSKEAQRHLARLLGQDQPGPV
jgi:HEPN domain-containing protein